MTTITNSDNDLIRILRKNVFEIAAPFARLRGMRRIMGNPLSEARLADLLANNEVELEALNLRDRAFRTFLRPDVIAGIKNLYGGSNAQTQFYIVIEASFTGDPEDVQRATEHAKILRCTTGLDAYPVVAGVRPNPNIEDRIFNDVDEFVEAGNADAVLWYRIDEVEMQPQDPG